LNNEPGVFSARYAGENATDEENNQKLLLSMKSVADRQAYFNCTVCYFDGEAKYFDGKLYGTIANDLAGNNGFGYDPLFILNDNKRLAQKTMDEKNKISHRAKAFSKWLEFMITRG
jgi:XTP/dITP diphosphohydrolase